MYLLKGFSEYNNLRINTPFADNPIGEFSARSRTYVKEKSVYIVPSISDQVILIATQSENNNVKIEVPLSIRDHVLNITKHVWNKTIPNPTVQLTYSDHVNSLISTFASVATEFTGGPIVTDGQFYVPEWISWKMIHNTQERRITIWFADAAFQQQYPDSETTVVPPIDNLDFFFQPGAQVEALLATLTTQSKTQRLEAAIGIYPATYFRYEPFDYHDPNNANRIIPVDWGIIIYGINGNNIDSIKESLKSYILANSSYNETDWKEIFPDIFKKNEFVIVPRWAKFAIPNMFLEKGIHSPFVTRGELSSAVRQACPNVNDYTNAHVNSYSESFGYPYRSLAMQALGHSENKNSKFRLSQMFSDWINVPVSQDYNRMSTRTKDWANLLFNCVHHAETFTENTSVPPGYLKLIRDTNRLWLTFTFEQVNYLVYCKKNVTAI